MKNLNLATIDPNKNKEKNPLRIPLMQGKIPTVRNLRTCKRLLSRLIAAFCRGEVMGDDAKTLAYLLSTYSQIIQGVEMENRLTQLETLTKEHRKVGSL
jgi:hypothetical protein